jgi:hypothetical protein
MVIPILRSLGIPVEPVVAQHPARPQQRLQGKAHAPAGEVAPEDPGGDRGRASQRARARDPQGRDPVVAHPPVDAGQPVGHLTALGHVQA